VVCGANPTSHANEACCDGVAELLLNQRMSAWSDSDFHTQTQIHDCHHERPSTMFADEIIHVLMLKESAVGN
jgi:hypothetical protein